LICFLTAQCHLFLTPPSFSLFLFVCLCFAQVASVLLQCLAALLLLGDPLGLEGCQHSVQPQLLQALWARREAKCSEKVLQQPAQEDLGKLPGAGHREAPSSHHPAQVAGAKNSCSVKNILALSNCGPRAKGPCLGIGKQVTGGFLLLSRLGLIAN
jgi:hypothetical protein